MGSILKNLKISLFFYLGLFSIQLIFYLAAPSFYVSSPESYQIPFFIVLSFLKFLGLILLLYLIWALAVAILNGVLFRPRISTSASQKKILLFLNLAQFLCVVLFLSIQFPSVLNYYPLLRDIPIGLTQGLLFTGILSLTVYLYRKTKLGGPLGGIGIISTEMIPMLFLLFLTRPVELDLPKASHQSQASPPHVLILGFDALDGDSANAAMASFDQQLKGTLFTNAFTPLPLTHPAWNSILTGLYPKHHQVRYFFDSPLEPKHPELYLTHLLKKLGNYQSLFASDQPETSYFNDKSYFDQWVLTRMGWEAHLMGTLFNHFIFPTLWLNNAWLERVSENSYNYSSLFNFDMARFFNLSFQKFQSLGKEAKLMALHSCSLHTPISLSKIELSTVSNYFLLKPREFSFWKWPAPGKNQAATPPAWVNPYYLRRKSVLFFLKSLTRELKAKGYLDHHLVVLLSDHGERFVQNKEIYGGIHGVDLETREQINVFLTVLDPRFKRFKRVEDPVSLIDVTPTLLSLLDYETSHLPFDGVALLTQEGEILPLPKRSLWVESMGYINDVEEKVRFPQISVKTLEESLTYEPNGAVTIGEEYYQRILKKKERLDISQNQNLIKATAATSKKSGGSPSL